MLFRSALTDILSFVGITNADGSPAADSDITAVSVSNESLFSASNESGEWMVTAHQAFHTDEWIKVTIDGVEYEITVTDAEAQYRVDVTVFSVTPTNFSLSTGTSYSTSLLWTPLPDNYYGTYLELDQKKSFEVSSSPSSVGIQVTYRKSGSYSNPCPYVGNMIIGENQTASLNWNNSIVSEKFSGAPDNVTVVYTVTVTPLHSHSWSYSADGNEIVATCNGSGTCLVGDQTLTLSTVSNKTYNGSAQTVPTYTTTDGWKTENGLEEPGTVTVSPANSANAGTYTASVSAGGATAQSSWTISKADITPSVTMNGWTYGANANSPSVSGNTGNGTVTYKYKVSTAADNTYSTTKPSNAGTYTVKAEIVETTNYNSGTATTNFTISKATNPLTFISTQSLSKTFSTSSQTVALTAATSGQGTMSYAINSQKNSSNTTVSYFSLSGTTLNVAANTPAGTYTLVVRATAAGDSNYNSGTKDSTVTVEINNASMNSEVSASDYTGTYDAAAHGITVKAPSDATVRYRIASSEDYYLTTNPTFTDAGIYTVYYQVTKPNYAAVTGSATVQINPKELTLTWGNNEFTYNGSPQAPTATIGGVINGDECNVSVNGAQTNYSATAYSATAELNGARKGNYVLPTDKTTTFTIDKKAATITANNRTVTYGTSIASDTNYATAETLASGDALTAITLTPSTSDVTSNGTITPSAATIKKGDTDVTNNYNITYDNGALTINKKPITISGITASNKTYDGTTAATLNYNGINWTECGMVAGDDLSVTATGTFSDANVGTGKTVTITGLTLGGTKAGNYELASSGQQTSTTANINAKAITITADSDSKVYDGTAHTKNSHSITNGELATGDRIESVTVTGSQTFVGSSDNVPSVAVIKNSSGVDVTGNYEITYTNGTLTVTRKPLTITADSAEKVYDTTPLTTDRYTYTELAEGDSISSVTVTGSRTSVGESYNVPRDAVIKKGEVDVTENYLITYVNGVLKVTKKTVTITANSDTKIYDGTALTNDNYTVSGLENDDRVDSVTITGTQTIVGESTNVPSEAVIKNAANEDVNENYSISYNNGTLKVTKKPITITANSDSKVYDGTALTKNGYTNSELTDGDRIESVTITGTQTVAGESANVPSAAVIKNAEGEDVTTSYDITYESGTLEVTKRPITIDGIAAEDKIFDGTTDVELDYSDIDWEACGMVVGDELSVTAAGTFDDSNAGEGKNVTITDIALDGESIDNYVLADSGQQTTATAAIIKKMVTVTALKQTVAVNGEIESSVEYAELTGALEGHELAEITLTSGSTERTTTEGVITPSDAKIVNGDTDVTDNYDISYIDGVMTVTKAEAEVVLDNGDDEASGSVTTVEAPNLLELADEEAEEGKLVKVELSVKPVSESKVSPVTVSDVKKAVESLFAFVDMESVKVEYLEIDLTKYVDNVKEGAISDTGKPLEIILTYDTSKAGNPVIIRNHEGTVTVFTQLSSRPTGNLTDATYYVEGNKIYMYSQYFSDFAIAYSVEKTFNVILDDGNGNIIRQIVSEGAKFIPPTDITKDGYDLDGWYKDETFLEKWNTEKDKVASDIKLFAKWTKKTEPAKVETPKADTPKAPATGDKMNMGVIVILMIGSALAALYLTLRRRLMK